MKERIREKGQGEKRFASTRDSSRSLRKHLWEKALSVMRREALRPWQSSAEVAQCGCIRKSLHGGSSAFEARRPNASSEGMCCSFTAEVGMNQMLQALTYHVA